MLRLLVVCAFVGWSTAVGAETKAPWVAVLRTSSPEDEALARRVQGQLSDLPVVLRVKPGTAPGSSDAEQWWTAVDLAASESARLALWFSHAPDGITVHIAEPSTQHLFVRRIQADPAGGRLSRSAMAEAAALVVRSAVKALEAGHEVGVEVKVEPQAPTPPAEPMPPVALEVPPRAELPPAVPISATPLREGAWVLAVGWQVAVDGASPRGQQGPQLVAGWEGRRLRARVLLLPSLPAHLSDAYTRVTLSRHALVVGAGVGLKPAERLRLGADFGAGLVGFHRRSVALRPDVVASPTRFTLAAAVSPELSARWSAGPVALEMSAAVDVMAGVPTLGYTRGDEFLLRNALWVAQPRLGLALLVGAP